MSDDPNPAAHRVAVQNDTGVPFDVAGAEMRERLLESLRSQVDNARVKLDRAKADVAAATEAHKAAKDALAFELSPAGVAAYDAGVEAGVALANRTPAERAAADLAAARQVAVWAEQALAEAQAVEASDTTKEG